VRGKETSGRRRAVALSARTGNAPMKRSLNVSSCVIVAWSGASALLVAGQKIGQRCTFSCLLEEKRRRSLPT